MKKTAKFRKFLWFLIFSPLIFVNCSKNSEADVPTEKYAEESTQAYPTLSNSLPELIDALSSPNDEIRIAAARKMVAFGPDAKLAISSLIQNLKHPNSEVRRSAVDALASLGELAKPSVRGITDLLLTDTAIQPRRQAAKALGEIGDVSAVPSLAKCLSDSDDGVAIQCAKSIGILANQQFPDMNSTSYRIDHNGIPLIVSAATEWWVNSGQYETWISQETEHP